MRFAFDWMAYLDFDSAGWLSRSRDVPDGGGKRPGTVILITFHTNALER
jgi:hypothetical protein